MVLIDKLSYWVILLLDFTVTLKTIVLPFLDIFEFLDVGMTSGLMLLMKNNDHALFSAPSNASLCFIYQEAHTIVAPLSTINPGPVITVVVDSGTLFCFFEEKGFDDLRGLTTDRIGISIIFNK